MSFKPKKRPKPKASPVRGPQKPGGNPIRQKVWNFLLSFATLIGIPAFVLTVLPRVSVSPPSPPVEQNNVLSVAFEVSNTGYIPLNDVSLGVAPALIDSGGPGKILGILKPNGVPEFKYSLYLAGSQHHNLGLDERITFDLAPLIKGNINKADIAIAVSYMPWFIPLHRQKLFRFVTVRDENGRTTWRSWPLDELAPTK